MHEPNRLPWNPSRREPTARKRILAAVAVIAVVLGWRLVVYAKARHLQNIGRELVAVNMLVKYPVPNNAGSQVLFAQSTDQGVGLYLLNIASGKRETVYELSEGRILSGSLLLLDWAPDDAMLAYAKPVKGKKQQVVLCSPSVVRTVRSLTVVGLIKEFRWLSPGAFAYLNNANDIYVVARGSHGKWAQTHEFKNVTSPPVTHFSALSPTALAWKQSGGIWTLDLASGRASPLWKPETNHLVSAYFSNEKGKLLVSARNRDLSYDILSLDPETRAAYALGKVTEPNISKVNWANAGKGFAFQCADHWGDSLSLRGRESEEQARLFSQGEVIDFKARRDKVFLYGSEGNEPPGIWEYNVGTGAMRCLVASTRRAFTFAKAIRHSSGTLTNGSRIITYQLWAPSHIPKGKRLPLILGQTPYRWNAYPYLAAAAGCQFVTVNRKSWEEGIEHWEEDVLAVQAEFAKRPAVDPKRLYLYGHSAETVPISSLAASRPELWKGALIPSPAALPDLRSCRLSALLIDAAELDPGQAERLSAYQAEAAKVGVEVKLVLHPKARHTSWSRSTEQAKVEALAGFLFAQ